MADPELTVSFRRPFAEQVAAWQLRKNNLVPTARWDDLWKGQHDRAFMVAGATKADLLSRLAQAVDKAVVEGQSLEEFRRDFRATVEATGWHGWTGEGTKAGEAWRTRIIYTTNLRTTYAAGRYAQLVEGNFKFWVYRHGGSLEPREQHLSWNGLILPADHPFWATHFPPNGWGCSCYVIGARSIRGAVRRGGDVNKMLPSNWRDLDPRTGEPDGIDRGWGYAPGADIVAEVREQVRAKARTHLSSLANALTSAVEELPPAPVLLPREARSVKEAAELVVELGLAEKALPWPTGANLNMVNQAITALYEIEQRFDMRIMQAVASATQLSRASGGRLKPHSKAYAWFAGGMNVMGWNKSGLAKPKREIAALYRDYHLPEHKAGVSRLSPGPAKDTAERTGWGWSVFDDEMDSGLGARMVAFHETGHRFHANFAREVNDAILDWRRTGWGFALSKYGTTNDAEFVAESFALYMKGQDHHWRIKPELLAVFKSKDKRDG